MTVRILGIDPGLTRCGAGVIQLGASRKVTLVEVQTFSTNASVALAERIGVIGDQIENLILRTEPAAIAIERVFAQQNLRSVMGVAQISGVVMLLAFRHNIPVYLHTPSEVKAAVTGSGRANKAQVGHMVAKILGLESIPKPADAADSLAIAICHAWKSAAGNPNAGLPLTSAQQVWAGRGAGGNCVKA